MAAPKAKKMRRMEEDVEHFDRRHLIAAILGLCGSTDLYKSHNTLTPLKIRNCNATASSDVSFSKAFCDTEPYDQGIVFGDVFHTGIQILRNFAETKTIPEERKMCLAFKKLLSVLNGEKGIRFKDPRNLPALSNRELALLVANHLLAKLATSSCYLVDQNCTVKRGDLCFCGEDSCKMTGDYGDTSIGNLEVWHGNLDVILIDDVAVEAIEDPPESPGGEPTVEVIKEKSALQRNPQLMAQTIVFSFLQKKRHPDRENFLTPCIGIGNSELIVLFYDSEHDVLLESSCVPLFENPFSCDFSYSAILVCWLVVNYEILCSGLTEEFKNCKSNFFAHASEKINIYEEKLKFQNVSSFHGSELKYVKASRKIKLTPLMHETEKMLLEVLWSLSDTF